MKEVLTLLLAAGEVLEEVDGDALWRRQVGGHVDGEEGVHLVLGAELGRELGGSDALFGSLLDLHLYLLFNNYKLRLVIYYRC